VFTLKNTATDSVYVAPTLTAARNYCSQHLLRADNSQNRTAFLSDLAAGLITVYAAAGTEYIGPGF
jgi:hypothetical protein